MASSSSSSSDIRQQDFAPVRRHHQYSSYGGNPLAHVLSYDNSQDVRLPAFGGTAQPGLYKPPPFEFGNPAPLGLAGFALTTFVLSLINLGVCDLASPSIVIAPALAYGGLCQLLAGMWEIALGNSKLCKCVTLYSQVMPVLQASVVRSS